MSKETRTRLLKYGITSFVSLLISYWVMSSRGLFDCSDTHECFKILADAFTIPGVILLCLGVLIWISTDGFFDGITYAFSKAGSMLIPFFGKEHRHERYYDYVMRKRGKRITGYGFLPIVGAVFTVVAVMFVVLYNVY